MVNGLSIPVRAAIAGENVQLRPGSHFKLNVPTGPQAITITTTAGQVIEQGTLRVEAGSDAQGWNILGAAPIFVEELLYQHNELDGTPAPEPTVLCGQREFGVDAVDYVFVEPPKNPATNRPNGTLAKEKRVHMDLATDTPAACVSWLEHTQGDRQSAAELARVLAELAGYPSELTRMAVILLQNTSGRDAAAAWLTQALEQHDDQVDLHRIYQDFRTDAGERAEVLAEYRVRLAAQPKDVLAGYLVARVETAAFALNMLRSLHERAPTDRYVLRAFAHALAMSGDHAGAIAAWRELEQVDRPAYNEAIPLIGQALAALGRTREALRALEQKVQGESSTRAFERALMYARVARL
ncbi:MAG: hypothetical protein RL701_7913, partial [Pseudomonadota bacterium]